MVMYRDVKFAEDGELEVIFEKGHQLGDMGEKEEGKGKGKREEVISAFRFFARRVKSQTN